MKKRQSYKLETRQVRVSRRWHHILKVNASLKGVSILMLIDEILNDSARSGHLEIDELPDTD